MFPRLFARGPVVVGTPSLLLAFAPALTVAQDASRSVLVLEFDQLAVSESAQEVFGGEYDLGNGIARLLADRLAEEGVEVQVGDGSGAGRVEGAILMFGKLEGGGEAGGVSVGRFRVGIGRSEEKAIVALEARLLDVASGQLVTSASGRAESDRGGWNAFARLRGGPDLASMDLSSDEFRETAIGEATHDAVEQLAESLADAVDRLGTFAAPEPDAAAAMPPGMPTIPSGGIPAGGVPSGAMPAGGMSGGAFAWAPFQFQGTEHFRYDVRREDGSDVETGYYQLDVEPAGQGMVRLNVDGRLGDETYRSAVTTQTGTQGMQMGMGQIMGLGPVGMMLLNPAAWMMMPSQELTVGDGWTYGSGGDSASMRVEESCAAAGQSGVLVVLRQNEEMVQSSCVARDVALPITLVTGEAGERLQLTLTEYRR